MKKSLPLKNWTVSQLLRRAAQRFPTRPALEYVGRVWTYSELDEVVDRTARRLLAWGVKRGDRVGLWCETEPNTIFLLYALPRIGAAAVRLNTSLQRSELAELLCRTEVSRLIVTEGYRGMSFPDLCRGLVEEVPTLEAVLYAGLNGEGGSIDALDSLDQASLNKLGQAEGETTPQDIGYILYTSGTTSVPKAVMSTKYSRVNSGIQQAHDLGAGPEDRFCVSVPIFHCFCLSANVMAACAAGACLYLPDLIAAVNIVGHFKGRLGEIEHFLYVLWRGKSAFVNLVGDPYNLAGIALLKRAVQLTRNNFVRVDTIQSQHGLYHVVHIFRLAGFIRHAQQKHEIAMVVVFFIHVFAEGHASSIGEHGHRRLILQRHSQGGVCAQGVPGNRPALCVNKG